MSDTPHLVIPFAAAELGRPALSSLQLPNLEKLLARLAPGPTDKGSEESLTPPHERVLAHAQGLASPDGLLPWAALEAGRLGLAGAADGAWAIVTPCHWEMASAHVDMDDPDGLRLTEAESRTLLAAMQTYFEEDGIALFYVTPTTWLARGEWFRGLATASLDRVAGRRVDDWMPRAEQARGLRRLQNEMQMLLYTHAVNDERGARGLAPVNSFWVSGTGDSPASPSRGNEPKTIAPRGLAEAVRRNDGPGWMATWQHIDATDCAALLQRLDQKKPVQLTLCGENHARSFTSTGLGLRQRIASLLSPTRLLTVLESL
ncbi:hypothetical protein RD110_17735 [Rhodoferax koreense]|uniref:Phosphoglycerate mutase n=1 Tax=Rhodoferax koreensis TaxID=1842727 RepID=A0A1P8JYI7_9BURK|nr:hypothetical protein [Rhodoferax koreense]APW38822.1 hypothetical protein RD110_17735 [Rhodoferax koreense]